MGGSSGDTTTVQKADPWNPMQSKLKQAGNMARNLYKEGAMTPDVYGGARVAGFSPQALSGMGMIQNEARGGTPLVDRASSSLSGLMGGDPTLAALSKSDPRLASMTSGKDIYRDLGMVKQNALGSAIPAAVSMFSGNGMTDSSAAMDTVGRAATEAVAPIDYGAWQAAQDRRLSAIGLDNQTRMGAAGQNADIRLSAAGMAPAMQQAGYLPGQMMSQVGAQVDGRNQATIDGRMQAFNERSGAQNAGFQQYLANIMGLGGMGQSGSSNGPSGQPSTGQKIGAAGLGGLGTYGALAAIPGIGAPMAIGGGALAAMMGLL